MADQKKINKRLSKISKQVKQSTQDGTAKVTSMVSKNSPTALKKPAVVTNKTLEQHREEVLSGAKRFIYPLQHSKHKIAWYSVIIISFVLIVMLTLTALLLYRWQNTSDFTYRLTQIVPFPVARVEGQFVSYEDYLFELRHNVHYLVEQEQVDFNQNPSQLTGTKEGALNKVKEAVIIKKTAKENNITVSEQEIDDQIAALTSEGTVGGIEQAETYIRDYFNWDIEDWRRSLHDQILKQKVTPILDSDAQKRAQAAKDDIDSGVDFEDVTEEHSDDIVTNTGGGELRPITRTNDEFPVEFISAVFDLEDGGISDFVQTPFGIHIIKHLETVSEDEVRVAHVFIQYKNIDDVLREQVEELGSNDYIDFE
jgi:hypothetical protein